MVDAMSLSTAISGAVLIVLLAVSVYTDLRYAKIFNKFVLPCIPLGLVIWGVGESWGGVIFSLQGLAVGCIALLISATMRWLAPGDAKLIAAIGALTGPGFVGSTMIFGAAIGGVMALAILLRKRMLGQWAAGTAVAFAGRLPVATAWTNRAGFMPYSLAIASGAILAAFLPLW
jgi:prepilin peptidase CpaA